MKGESKGEGHRDEARSDISGYTSATCLRFGHWLTLCTLNIHILTYLLTYQSSHTW